MKSSPVSPILIARLKSLIRWSLPRLDVTAWRATSRTAKSPRFMANPSMTMIEPTCHFSTRQQSYATPICDQVWKRTSKACLIYWLKSNLDGRKGKNQAAQMAQNHLRSRSSYRSFEKSLEFTDKANQLVQIALRGF